MLHAALGATKAHDVVTDIIRANPTIEAITTVAYVESGNWIDKIGDGEFSAAELSTGMQQDRGSRTLQEMSRKTVLAGGLQKTQSQLSPNQLLGITSRVNVRGGEESHIPMMDFSCAISQENLHILEKLLPNTGQKHGCILESGRSYHYYGKEVLGHNEWIRFLGKCLLMKNFVDERYIGHQLVDGYCVLRVSRSMQKPVLPIMVSCF